MNLLRRTRKAPRSVRVGVDLDGCMYDFGDALRQYRHQVEGVPLATMPLSNCWHFYEQQWGMTLDEFIGACDRGVDNGWVFRRGAALPGSVEAVNLLFDQGHEIHIITDRSFGHRSQENTHEWLAENKVKFTSITFSRDKTLVPTETFIDDRVENYTALDAAGVQVCLLNQPWNENFFAARRIYNWREYVTHVNSLAEREVMTQC